MGKVSYIQRQHQLRRGTTKATLTTDRSLDIDIQLNTVVTKTVYLIVNGASLASFSEPLKQAEQIPRRHSTKAMEITVS